MRNFTKTITVPNYKVKGFEYKMDTLNRRLIREGFEPFSMEKGDEAIVPKRYVDGTKEEVMCTYFTVKGADGQRLGDYEAVAKIEFTGLDGFDPIVKAFTGEDGFRKYSDSKRCDHCGHKRSRNVAYIVRQGDDEKQVGSSCVVHYTGHEIHLSYWSGVDLLDEYEGVDWPRRNSNLDLGLFLRVTSYVIAKEGFKSRSKNPNDSTGSTVLDIMIDQGKLKELKPILDEKYTDSSQEIIEFFKSLGMVDSDYMSNLKHIAKRGFIRWSEAGYAASMVPAYARELDKLKEKEDAGPVPEGRKDVNGEIVSIKEVDTGYGYTLKMLVRLSNGSKVYGTIPKSIRGSAEIGNHITFRATFEASKDDASFGFIKRPSGGEIVS